MKIVLLGTSLARSTPPCTRSGPMWAKWSFSAAPR